MGQTGWTPSAPRTNPFVRAGVPNYIGGRFEERQQLVDWVHSSDRSPLLLGGVRGAGKTTVIAWLADYLTFDPEDHFKASEAPTPVYLRGDQPESLISQLTADHETTVTSEVGGGVIGLRAKWSESATHSAPRTLLEAMPSGHVVIIDEAQSMSQDQLNEVATFLETPGSQYSGKVLMVGTPDLFSIHPPDGTFGLFGRCPQIPLAATQSREETADTLIGTVTQDSPDHGTKRFADEAIDKIHATTGGYPTAIQIAGYYSYMAAGDVIEPRHVELGFGGPAGDQLGVVFDQMVRRQGASGRMPHLRQSVLEHLAVNGPSTSAAIADALDKPDSRSISSALDHLQRSGLVAPSEQRLWQIVVPLLGEYVLHRQSSSP